MGHEAHFVAQRQADANRSGVNAKYAGSSSHLPMTSECSHGGKPWKIQEITAKSPFYCRFIADSGLRTVTKRSSSA
jgi:hypothetical protein